MTKPDCSTIEIDLDLWMRVGYVVLASEKLLNAIESSNSAGAVFYATHREECLALDEALKGISRIGFKHIKK
jgi:hypothetical protein